VGPLSPQKVSEKEGRGKSGGFITVSLGLAVLFDA